MFKLIIIISIFMLQFSLLSYDFNDDYEDDDYKSKYSTLITKISTNSTPQAGMAMIIALNALKYDAKNSIIIIGGDSLKFIKRGAHLTNFEPATIKLHKNITIKDLLKSFIKRGGKVVVCKLCLVPDKLIKYDILKGIKIVSGKELTEIIYTKNAKIISF